MTGREQPPAMPLPSTLSPDERAELLFEMTTRACRLARESSDLALMAIAFAGDALGAAAMGATRTAGVAAPSSGVAGADLPEGLAIGPDGELTTAPAAGGDPDERPRRWPRTFHSRRDAAEGGASAAEHDRAHPSAHTPAIPADPGAAPSPSSLSHED